MKLEISEAVFQVLGIAIVIQSFVKLFIETITPKIK